MRILIFIALMTSSFVYASDGVFPDNCARPELQKKFEVVAPTRQKAIPGLALYPGEIASVSASGVVDANRRWWQEKVCARFFGIKISCKWVWRTAPNHKAITDAFIGFYLASSRISSRLFTIDGNQYNVSSSNRNKVPTGPAALVWLLDKQSQKLQVESNIGDFNAKYQVHTALANKLRNGRDISNNTCGSKPPYCSGESITLTVDIDVSQRASDFTQWLGANQRRYSEIATALRGNLGNGNDDVLLKVADAIKDHYRNPKNKFGFDDSNQLIALALEHLEPGKRNRQGKFCNEKNTERKNLSDSLKLLRADLYLKSGDIGQAITEAKKIEEDLIEVFAKYKEGKGSMDVDQFANLTEALQILSSGYWVKKVGLDVYGARESLGALLKAEEVLTEWHKVVSKNHQTKIDKGQITQIEKDDFAKERNRFSNAFTQNTLKIARTLQKVGTISSFKQAAEKFAEAEKMIPIIRKDTQVLDINHHTNSLLIAAMRSSFDSGGKLPDLTTCQAHDDPNFRRLKSGFFLSTDKDDNELPVLYKGPCIEASVQCPINGIEYGQLVFDKRELSGDEHELINGNCDFGLLTKNKEGKFIRYTEDGSKPIMPEIPVELAVGTSKDGQVLDDSEEATEEAVVVHEDVMGVFPTYGPGSESYFCKTQSGLRSLALKKEGDADEHPCGVVIEETKGAQSVSVSKDGLWIFFVDANGVPTVFRQYNSADGLVYEDVGWSEFISSNKPGVGDELIWGQTDKYFANYAFSNSTGTQIGYFCKKEQDDSDANDPCHWNPESDQKDEDVELNDASKLKHDQKNVNSLAGQMYPDNDRKKYLLAVNEGNTLKNMGEIPMYLNADNKFELEKLDDKHKSIEFLAGLNHTKSHPYFSPKGDISLATNAVAVNSYQILGLDSLVPESLPGSANIMEPGSMQYLSDYIVAHTSPDGITSILGECKSHDENSRLTRGEKLNFTSDISGVPLTNFKLLIPGGDKNWAAIVQESETEYTINVYQCGTKMSDKKIKINDAKFPQLIASGPVYKKHGLTILREPKGDIYASPAVIMSEKDGFVIDFDDTPTITDYKRPRWFSDNPDTKMYGLIKEPGSKSPGIIRYSEKDSENVVYFGNVKSEEFLLVPGYIQIGSDENIIDVYRKDGENTLFNRYALVDNQLEGSIEDMSINYMPTLDKGLTSNSVSRIVQLEGETKRIKSIGGDEKEQLSLDVLEGDVRYISNCHLVSFNHDMVDGKAQNHVLQIFNNENSGTDCKN